MLLYALLALTIVKMVLNTLRELYELCCQEVLAVRLYITAMLLNLRFFEMIRLLRLAG